MTSEREILISEEYQVITDYLRWREMAELKEKLYEVIDVLNGINDTYSADIFKYIRSEQKRDK